VTFLNSYTGVGTAEGAKLVVGANDEDGAIEGEPDGACVGPSVGTDVGSELGDCEGLPVGPLKGIPVGVGVGSAIGPKVSGIGEGRSVSISRGEGGDTPGVTTTG